MCVAGVLTGKTGRRIVAHLPEVITDRFVQRFQRPFGDVWQVWILVDRSQMAERVTHPIAMEGHSNRAVATSEHRVWATHILSLVGIVVVILAAYLFLNAAPRGYYAWALRIAAAVLALIGVLCLA